MEKPHASYPLETQKTLSFPARSPLDPKPIPKNSPHPGERLANYFDNFFKTIVGISTLGASLTFSKILSSPVKPFQQFGYSEYDAQWYLSVSWLLFLLDLAFTSFFATMLSLYRPQAIKAFGKKLTHDRWVVMWYATCVSALLFSLVIAAAIFLGLVVVVLVRS